MNGYNAPQSAPSNGGSGSATILNDCRSIDKAIDDLESRLQGLQSLHRRVLNDQASSSQIDTENSDIMTTYRSLGSRLKAIKSDPASQSASTAPQVGRVDRRLKAAITQYQRVEAEFRKAMQAQQARQYRIVRPEATDAEVAAAVEDSDGGDRIFQQALLSADRSGQARSALGAVRARHDEIRRIEQTMVELAQLFQDLDQIVLAQEPLVQTIEQKGEEVRENIIQANVELDKGVVRYVFAEFWGFGARAEGPGFGLDVRLTVAVVQRPPGARSGSASGSASSCLSSLALLQVFTLVSSNRNRIKGAILDRHIDTLLFEVNLE